MTSRLLRPESGPRSTLPWWAFVLVTLIVVVGGCTDDPAPQPTSSTNSASPTSTPTTPAWRDDFTQDQIDAYESALKAWEEYERVSEPIWAEGRATPAAKRVFQQYLAQWQAYWAQLGDYEKQHIKIGHNGTTLTSEPTRVVIADDGVSVSIRQCVDSTKIQATQNGEPLEMAFSTPQVRDVFLNQVDDDWRISQIKSSTEDRPCAG